MARTFLDLDDDDAIVEMGMQEKCEVPSAEC